MASSSNTVSVREIGSKWWRPAAVAAAAVVGVAGCWRLWKARNRGLWCRGPPAQVGGALADVDTPALLVDLAAAEHNIAEMENKLRPFPFVRLRPIVKAHKCVGLAKLQVNRSRRATGVCCAKLCEAEAMMRGGVTDVLLSNEIVSPTKMQVLLACAYETGSTLTVCVDNADVLPQWSRASKEHGVMLGVCVEVNTGQNRCGVQTVDEAVELAVLIRKDPHLRFMGLQGYHGAAQHIRSLAERESVIEDVCVKMKSIVDKLEAEHKVHCITVTGGGTGTFEFEAASGVYTEVQPGTYLFGDVDYSKNLDASGHEVKQSIWKQSMLVYTTVMSVNDHGHWVVVDAGIKAHSIDSGMPQLLGHPEVTCKNGGDEHFILLYPKESPLPKLGSKLFLVPGHCDPTFNMYDYVVAFRDGLVEHVWPIEARGPGR